MRVFHIVDSMDPADGGPPTSVACLAAAQASRGCSVTVLCHESPGRQAEIERALSLVPGFDRVDLVAVSVERGIGKLTGRAAGAWLRGHLARGDIVHIQGLWRPLLYTCGRIARSQRVPYVVAPRGMLATWSLRQKRIKKQLALQAGWRKLLNEAAFLHVLNRDEAAQPGAVGVHAPLKVLPNGVFPQSFNDMPAQGTFHQRHPEFKARPYILFLGRLHHVKGLDLLADAYAILAQRQCRADLVIAGPNAGADRALRRQVQQLGVAERVHIVGPLYGVDKYAALVDAECLCQPSRQEGFSMAITEAMACGLPVVISENCHFPEVAENGAGEVVALEPEAMADGLARLLGNEAKRKLCGAAGRRLVLTRYAWPAIAQQCIEAYEEALTE